MACGTEAQGRDCRGSSLIHTMVPALCLDHHLLGLHTNSLFSSLSDADCNKTARQQKRDASGILFNMHHG